MTVKLCKTDKEGEMFVILHKKWMYWLGGRDGQDGQARVGKKHVILRVSEEKRKEISEECPIDFFVENAII